MLEFLIALPKLAQQWLVFVPLGIHLEPNKVTGYQNLTVFI